ncbi:hypothetical protein F5Y13DRAFT_203898 [Hypoxylon sp. FL1857]|nr:hypothetical protein F5Y13DRAFT_203898 [Hypoxylon sp. FL1857]
MFKKTPRLKKKARSGTQGQPKPKPQPKLNDGTQYRGSENEVLNDPETYSGWEFQPTCGSEEHDVYSKYYYRLVDRLRESAIKWTALYCVGRLFAEEHRIRTVVMVCFPVPPEGLQATLLKLSLTEAMDSSPLPVEFTQCKPEDYRVEPGSSPKSMWCGRLEEGDS